MKSRDYFLPSLSGVLVAGLILFQSCAHQNRNSEDVDVPNEDVYSESETGQESQAETELSQTDTQDESVDSSKQAQSDEGSDDLLAESENLDEKSKETDSFEKELEADSASNEVSSQIDTKKIEAQNSTQESSLEAELESDAPTANSNAGSQDLLADSSDLENETKSSQGNSPEVLSPSVIQPKTDELEAKDSISSQIDPIFSSPAEPKKSWSKRSFIAGGSRVPKIPAKAVTKRGKKLNRFYFVRKGDSPKKVSSLIYGSPAKSKSLTWWNGGAWTAGKLIYYMSPKNPSDTKMESYYKENGIIADEYEVKKGDWLSKIAKNQLGDPKSWVEIAVVNGIKSPKSLEVGQKIAIYPRNLTPQPLEPVIAQTAPETAPVVAQQQPVVPPPTVVAPPPTDSGAAPTNNEATTPPETTAKEPVASQAVGFDAQKFIEQNMFAGLMGLAGLLLLLLLVVKKRRKAREASADDFDNGEEGFQPPTKLKRR